jgi:hypothetical protein
MQGKSKVYSKKKLSKNQNQALPIDSLEIKENHFFT